jgi:transcriptional regulator with XRE-family HTH domain
LTQAQLAAASGVTRVTVNRLENGDVPDIGINKVQALLKPLGLILAVQPAPASHEPDFLRMACVTASVSFKEPLTERELTRALLTGRVAANRRPHLRVLLEEAAPDLLQGVVRQVGRWTQPGKVERNLAKIAVAVGSSRREGR